MKENGLTLRAAVLFVVALTMCLCTSASTARAQSVVINKFFNSGTTADAVELLVIENNLDLRGMIIKDFSSSNANDNGGRYQFSTNAVWASVPAGTLIVLRNDTSAADSTAGGGDYNLDLGLRNTSYFAALGGTFDIATVDMIMIKAAGSGADGLTGSIHVLAGGAAGTQFVNAPTPKLRATSGAGTGQYVYANNSTSTLADYNGTDATGAATNQTLGSANNAANQTFINSLRNGGGGTIAEPTQAASNVAFSNVTSTSFTVSFTPGNGSSRLVVVKQGGSVDAQPVDGTTYTANPAFGQGSDLGNANFVVAAGNVSSVTVTNLTANTNYSVAIYEANGNGTSINYLTASFGSGSITTAAVYSVSGIITNASGAGVAGVRVTLTIGNTSQTAITDANGNYTFANIAAGSNLTITASGSGLVFTPASQTVTNINGSQTINFSAVSGVIISEFRTRGETVGDGQTGSTNEFIELYNLTGNALDVSGLTLRTSDGITLTVNAGASVPSRGNYLIAGAGFEGTAADAQLSLGVDIADGAGIGIFTSSTTFTSATRLDAVGFASADALYREGAGLQPASGINQDGSYSFVRRFNLTTFSVKDTNDNAADFAFVSPDAGVYSGVQSTLGAAGAQSTVSASERTATQVSSTLIDSSASVSAAPNRIRDLTPVTNGSNGTLEFRKTFTNNTGEALTSLRFRIVDLTTAPATSSTVMDLRAVSSGDVNAGSMVVVRGTTVETPPSGNLGGGVNSSLVVANVSPDAPLAAGGSINVRFVLGVNNAGRTYRFVTVTEAGTRRAPVTSSSEHLVMGNPTNATVDASQPTNYLLEKPQYVMSYHRDRGISNWVSWHLDTSWLGSAPRQNDFRNDASLPSGWYQVQSTDYSGSGYDRGHMCPSADRTRTIPDNSATFLMTNMIPQAPSNNQGAWADLENYCRDLVRAGNELYIISGGQGSIGTLAGGRVTIPNRTWKVIVVLPVGEGDDAGRVTTSTRVIAVDMPNSNSISTNWRDYRTSVDAVEALTGQDYLSRVPTSIQSVIEARVDNQ